MLAFNTDTVACKKLFTELFTTIAQTELEEQTTKAMDASNFQWGTTRTALDRGYATQTLQTQRAESMELQNLSDMIYQLNQQKANI